MTNKAKSPIVTNSSTADYQVKFHVDDGDNPGNWPAWYRAWVMVTVSFSAWVVVLYSTSYTSTLPRLQDELKVSRLAAVMGLTTYMTGLALGSLMAPPLSELYGRRVVYLVSLGFWSLFIVPAALANSMTVILVARLFSGLFGAALISNGPGTIVDVSKPDHLASGMSLYSLGPFNGPVLGPLIGGFVSERLGWRWANWIVLILGGVSLAMMMTVKETYGPEILRRRAGRLRKASGCRDWWCQYDHDYLSTSLFRVNLLRPCVLFFTEPIVWFINLWNALVYGVLYLCFVAYPVVFSHHRGWGPGPTGLSFLGIGFGIVLAIVLEPLIRRSINGPEAAALVMVFGSLLTPVGQLGFSWTCLPETIHWSIPILFGVPFGAGNTLSFIYSSNYLAGAYGIYAASALASNAVIRSLFGAALPLAGTKMYETLTPQIAGTLCAVLEVALIPIPFVFWKYGSRIRDGSKAIRQLRENAVVDEEKRGQAA
ncbi:hypothetical protein L249_3665 [Ophiocordyceps polyrhachis-furcata BCC 54312]|uniref:Major facilitator superfamily (MFS) profile domain-containing protein n=1 Tax=Ophiocordyceps polyrhachis-furcata BCC 54312 TaxID=1330021 RepID=A0A367L4S1_9HYPO|nr:hypothetical protein L249_3665 [Ophiocordyceps polyrhachis-furcata BCC 54312]